MLCRLKRPKVLIGLFFIIIGLGVLYKMEWASEDSEINFITSTVKRGDIASHVLAVGRIEAIRQVDIGAQVSGEISTLKVGIGDSVRENDLIAEIDASTQVNMRNTANAQLVARKAALKSAKDNLTEAQNTLQRQSALFKKGIIAKEILERAQSAEKNAQAAVTQAESAVISAQIELETAGLNLEKTSVRSPISGVITAVLVEKGQTLSAVQNVPTLVKVAQTDRMRVRAEISEADIIKIRQGMPATFTLLGNKTDHYETTVISIDPSPTFVSDNKVKSDGAVYYYATMEVDNPDNALRIGMTANIQIMIDRTENALLIPLAALYENEKKQTVVKVLNGKNIEERQVDIGLSDGINVAVISGVSEEELVVVSQQNRENVNAFEW